MLLHLPVTLHSVYYILQACVHVCGRGRMPGPATGVDVMQVQLTGSCDAYQRGMPPKALKSEGYNNHRKLSAAQYLQKLRHSNPPPVTVGLNVPVCVKGHATLLKSSLVNNHRFQLSPLPPTTITAVVSASSAKLGFKMIHVKTSRERQHSEGGLVDASDRAQ